MEQSLREFHPDILVYNAGTDVLDGDTLGLLAISAQVSKHYKILLNTIYYNEVCKSDELSDLQSTASCNDRHKLMTGVRTLQIGDRSFMAT